MNIIGWIRSNLKRGFRVNKSMAIDFKSYDELFEESYQLNYINLDGHITVGPNTYSVFHNYTINERQIIFQVCEKYLPWQYSELQEDWEKTMYMYQWVIKSPAPFPYAQYTLSEDIKMAISWTCSITNVNTLSKRADILFTRIDDVTSDTWSHRYSQAIIETQQQRLDLLNAVWAEWQDQITKDTNIANFITNLEQTAKSNLEGRET